MDWIGPVGRISENVRDILFYIFFQILVGKAFNNFWMNQLLL